MTAFRDRWDAGRQLAGALRGVAPERPVVLALPRGGVPVGYEVARALSVPLHLWLVRRVVVPWHPGLGLGAVAEGGFVHVDRRYAKRLGISELELSRFMEDARQEVQTRSRLMRGNQPPPAMQGCHVLLIDDGVSTGGTVRAAIQSVRASSPKTVTLAVPVADVHVTAALRPELDQLIALHTPPSVHRLASWYADFPELPEEEVARIVARANQEPDTRGEAPNPAFSDAP